MSDKEQRGKGQGKGKPDLIGRFSRRSRNLENKKGTSERNNETLNKEEQLKIESVKQDQLEQTKEEVAVTTIIEKNEQIKGESIESSQVDQNNTSSDEKKKGSDQLKKTYTEDDSNLSSYQLEMEQTVDETNDISKTTPVDTNDEIKRLNNQLNYVIKHLNIKQNESTGEEKERIIRRSFDYPARLIKRLKLEAPLHGRTMTEIMVEALENWFEKNGKVPEQLLSLLEDMNDE